MYIISSSHMHTTVNLWYFGFKSIYKKYWKCPWISNIDIESFYLGTYQWIYKYIHRYFNSCKMNWQIHTPWYFNNFLDPRFYFSLPNPNNNLKCQTCIKERILNLGEEIKIIKKIIKLTRKSINRVRMSL